MGESLQVKMVFIAMISDTFKILSTCNFADENKVFYPNIHRVLLLLLSLPVGSCSCERSFSALRRLKTWCRSSMTDERLDQLALGFSSREGTSSLGLLRTPPNCSGLPRSYLVYAILTRLRTREHDILCSYICACAGAAYE